MEFIRGTTLVHLKVRCWSGEKKASRDLDIQLGKDGKIPPQKMLDLGRKKIFPPSALDPMNNKRKAAERACLAVGTRFMGGYAIPDHEIDELVTRLNSINTEFDASLSDFLAKFDENRDAWLLDEEVKEFAHILENQIPGSTTVAESYGFSYKLYKINPLEGYEPDEGEIANQVLHEVGQGCRQMVKRLLERNTAISGQKLREQLEPFCNKLDTLSFGNGRILAVLREFKSLYQMIPLERIDKDHPKFGPTVTFLSMCDDAEKLERMYQGDFSVSELVQRPSSNSAPAETQPSPSIAAPAPAAGRVVGYF
ncbi:DUF3150 domain-containing protein [Zhongshania marina]|uniref:DUF3150 domain-containing protein n=1 Tax=Zhongshania marina TaxID=2304603 RepID=A0A2S4HBY9_9GAMM|nr:DUF3150 domain-containing protein [Marortus luteolus]POP51504.1 DUF3150 domain-containing protein [Marortus luteolus]